MLPDNTNVTIKNNVLHQNISIAAPVETGGIHAQVVSVFRPRWYHNCITANSIWGIFCEPANSGVRINYNTLFANSFGSLSPSCAIPGQPAPPNQTCNPFYLSPALPLLDLRLAFFSCARDSGDPTLTDPDGTRADAGALVPDGRTGGTQAVTVVDTASAAAISIPAGIPNPGAGPPSEVVIIARQFTQMFDAGKVLSARIFFGMNPQPTDLSAGLTLTFPLIHPLPPGTAVELATVDLFANLAQRTGLFGTVSASGLTAVVPNVTQLGWMVCLSGGPPTDVLTFAIFLDVILGVDADPGHVAMADLNRDGRTDGADIQSFVQRAIGP